MKAPLDPVYDLLSLAEFSYTFMALMPPSLQNVSHLCPT